MRSPRSSRETIPLFAVTLALASLMAATASAQVGAIRFATGLAQPTYLTAPPGDTMRVFVTERTGAIRILDRVSGTLEAAPFLSIGSVETLSSMAFDPDYVTNGRFFVFYHDTSNFVRVVRYEVSASDPDVADGASATPVLSLFNAGHFGGWMGFGPDGFLYVQIGDGGDFMSHDAPGNGQGTTGELLANVLRVDVDGDDFPADPSRNYAIPASNPFVGTTGLDEIWAYGLRNPWRGSFDRLTGDYYLGDVGQDTREEIDCEPAGSAGGRNYGWRLREGTIATPTGGVGGPAPPGAVEPVYDYVNGAGPSEGASVTGGYVHRGSVAALRGRYVFGDFVNPRIWSITVDPATGTATDFVDWTTALTPDIGSFDSIVSFGEDGSGELYVIDFDGDVFRIVGPSSLPLASPLARWLFGIGLVMVATRWSARGRRCVPA